MTSLVPSKEHTTHNTHTQRTNSRPARSVARDGLLPLLRELDNAQEQSQPRTRLLLRAHWARDRQHIRTELLAGEILPLAA
jgi:hypothetical protein